MNARISEKPLLETTTTSTKPGNNLLWLNELVAVIDDYLLPPIRSVAIATDVLMEEMGIGDDPGLVICRKHGKFLMRHFFSV